MAKPFTFRLQKVLEYRASLEDQAKLALSRAQAEHDAQERAVHEVEARLQAHVNKGWGENPTENDLWLFRQYKTALTEDLASARELLGRLALKLQKCRQDAVQRSRDRKLLDKLKEKQAKQHHEEQALKEQKEFDEMAAIRHPRKDV